MKTLVLASTSVYRQELLHRLKLTFEALSPGVNEDLEKHKNLPPQQLAETLATLKARAVTGKGRVVIGGDQLVNFQGEILGKPGNAEKAKLQLKKLSGQWHELITSVCVWSEEGETIWSDITRLKLRSLSNEEIERYVLEDKAWDCAGAYKIEKLGITLMEKIETHDFTAIQGLPLVSLSEVLRSKGFLLP